MTDQFPPLPYPILRCLIEGSLCEGFDPNQARTFEELLALHAMVKDASVFVRELTQQEVLRWDLYQAH